MDGEDSGARPDGDLRRRKLDLGQDGVSSRLEVR